MNNFNHQVNNNGIIEKYVHMGYINGNVNIFFQKDKVFPAILTDSYPKPVLKNIVIREQELVEFHDLVKDQKFIAITGFGGVGKTTFAGLYREKYIHEYEHLVWINCISNENITANNDSIVKYFYNNKLLDNLGIIFDKPVDIDSNFYNEAFGKITNRLNEITKKSLLIIDNANSQVDENQFYSKLTSLNENWKILITSRENISQHFELYELKFLTIVQSRELFYLFYKRENNDTLVDEIVKIVGLHTLTIELLAKTAQANRSLHLEKLKKLLHADGLNISKAALVKVKSTYDKVGVNTYIFECLTAAFSMITDLHETAKKRLLQFSVLPSIYIPYKDILKLLKIGDDNQADFNEDLNYLRDKGLVSETEEGDLKCHQVLQEVVRNTFKPTAEDCNDLIDSLIEKTEYNPISNPIEKAKYLPFAESVLHNLKEENIQIASLAHNMNDVYDSIGEYEKAIACELKAIKIREQLCADSLELAQSYNDIAVSYRRDNNLKESLAYHRKSLKLRRKILDTKHPDIAESYMNIAAIFYNKNIIRAIKLYNIALSLLNEKTSGDNDSVVKIANVYNDLGMCFLRIGDLVSSQKFIEYSLEIQRKIYNIETHPDIISSMKNLGTILLRQYKYTDAKVILKRVLELQKSIYNNNHPFVLDTIQILDEFSEVNKSNNPI